MQFYKHWAKGSYKSIAPNGKVTEFACHRWSDTSAAHASERARNAAKTLSEIFSSQNQLNRSYYGMDGNPMREEVLKEFLTENGQQSAVITRNSYGSLVLNTSSAMFIDIDRNKESNVFSSLIGKMLGNKPEPIVDKITKLASEKNLSLRLYETAAGWRCLVTSKTFKPKSSESSLILEYFNSDPLYTKLCSAQDCFRARLTPKYWRCKISKPPRRFPWESSEEESAYRTWEEKYNEACKNLTTCKFIASIGNDSIRSDIQSIVSLHDSIACRGDQQRLA